MAVDVTHPLQLHKSEIGRLQDSINMHDTAAETGRGCGVIYLDYVRFMLALLRAALLLDRILTN